VPSVQSVEVLDEGHYKTIVRQKVGFISATFEIQTEVLEELAPERLVLANTGKTVLGANGHLRSVDTITLTRLSDRETKIRLESELILGGQLAVLGAKLIQVKSKEIIGQAVANLKDRLEGTGTDAAQKL